MNQAEELLNSLTEEDVALYTANLGTDGHIVIDDDRFIIVPNELKRIAVQYDHNAELVRFDCPRYLDNVDMSEKLIYINYQCPDGTKGAFMAIDVHVDEENPKMMHFDWVLSRNVTQVKGKLRFLVCIKSVDSNGNELIHWNSEICEDVYISEGLECTEDIPAGQMDIISQLTKRIEKLEARVAELETNGGGSGGNDDPEEPDDPYEPTDTILELHAYYGEGVNSEEVE